VIVSYYEWLQNKRAEQWEIGDVLGRLERRMKQSYQNVRQYALANKTDWRTASYAIGLERLQHVYKERGIFP
jgi:glutamate dehydrogenase (NAD(P)+)